MIIIFNWDVSAAAMNLFFVHNVSLFACALSLIHFSQLFFYIPIMLPLLLFVAAVGSSQASAATVRWKVPSLSAGRLGEVASDVKPVALSELRYDATRITDDKYKEAPWVQEPYNFKGTGHPLHHHGENFEQPVDGLANKVTFASVFETMRRSGCKVYVLGGEVRDAILGLASMDTDIAFMCEADKVAMIAETNGWKFSHRNGRSYINLGNPGDAGLEGKDADTSLDATRRP